MDRKEFIENLTTKLKEWDAELDKLEIKAEKAKVDAKADYQREIEKLREQRQEAKAKLEQVKEASGAAWSELKTGTEEAFGTFKKSVQDALSKFKS